MQKINFFRATAASALIVTAGLSASAALYPIEVVSGKGTDLTATFTEPVERIDLVFSFNNGDMKFTQLSEGVSEFQVTDEVGNPVTNANVAVEFGSDWLMHYIFTFPDPIAATGTWLIQIPEGSLAHPDGHQNEAGSIAFKTDISAPEQPAGFTATITPKEGTVDINLGFALGTIQMTYDNDVMIVDGGPRPYITDGKGNRIEAEQFISLSGLGMPKVVNANFSDPTEWESGTYTFTMPAGAVKNAEGGVNAAQTMVYNLIGKTHQGTEDPDAVSIKTATLEIGSTTYNLMETGNKIDIISHQSIVRFSLENYSSRSSVPFKISDITDCVDGDLEEWSKAEGLYYNYADRNGNEYYKSIYQRNGIKLYEGKKYVFLIMDSQNNAIAASALIDGATEPYRYSPVNIVSIDPTPGVELATNVFTIKFDGPVEVKNDNGYTGFSLGSAGWEKMQSVTSNDDKTEWYLTLQEKTIKKASGPLSIHAVVYAEDMDGKIVRPAFLTDNPEDPAYNSGIEGNTRMNIRYSEYSACPHIDVTPLEGDQISELTFSAGSKEINPSYAVGQAWIYDSKGEKVASLVCDGYIDAGGSIVGSGGSGGSNGYFTRLTIKLSQPLTEAGYYTLDLPFGFFNVGRETSAVGSYPEKFMITVGNAMLEITDDNLDFAPVSTQAGSLVNGIISIETADEEGAWLAVNLPEGAQLYSFVKKGGRAAVEEGLEPAENNRVFLPIGMGTVVLQAVVGDVASESVQYSYNVAFNSTLGVDGIDMESEASVVWYNIHGQRVENPGKGLYIRVSGNKAEKVMK